jgi:hypothetical protein
MRRCDESHAGPVQVYKTLAMPQLFSSTARLRSGCLPARQIARSSLGRPSHSQKQAGPDIAPDDLTGIAEPSGPIFSWRRCDLDVWGGRTLPTVAYIWSGRAGRSRTEHPHDKPACRDHQDGDVRSAGSRCHQCFAGRCHPQILSRYAGHGGRGSGSGLCGMRGVGLMRAEVSLQSVPEEAPLFSKPLVVRIADSQPDREALPYLLAVFFWALAGARWGGRSRETVVAMGWVNAVRSGWLPRQQGLVERFPVSSAQVLAGGSKDCVRLLCRRAANPSWPIWGRMEKRSDRTRNGSPSFP